MNFTVALPETSDLIFASFNHLTLRHLGRRFEPAEIVALFGPPEEGAIEKVFGREAVPALMDELCAFYEQHHARMASVHEGVAGMLEFLKRRGVRLGVFTGKGTRTTEITLGSLGLSAYFDLVVTGNDVTHHKPHPEGIRRVLDHFRVPAEETVMVGDSLSDIKASRAAGVRMAPVLWDPYQRERLRGEAADLVFETVDEMQCWFRACLNGRNNVTPLEVGVIGVGHLGSLHAKMLSQMKTVHLARVYDLDAARARAIAEEFSTRAFDSLDGVLEHVQAITIATSTSTHYEVACRALERGLHLFIEKRFQTQPPLTTCPTRRQTDR